MTLQLRETHSDSSPRSVQNAVVELQLRAQLLDDEIRYYESLHKTSRIAYEDHRTELDELIGKERRYIGRREAMLQERLQSILAETSTLQYRLGQEQARASTEVTSAVEQTREDALMYERKIQSELESTHTDLMNERATLEKLLSNHLGFKKESEELKAKQEHLQREVRRLTEENQRLLQEQARQEALKSALVIHADDEIMPHPSPQRTTLPPPVRIQHPFIPAGHTPYTTGVAGGVRGKKAAKALLSSSRCVTFASHNVHAVAQAARRSNFRSPPKSSPPRQVSHASPSKYTNRQYESLGRSLAEELQDLYADYERISQHLDTPAGPSPTVSAKLRTLYQRIETKRAQLHRLRASQARHEESERFNELMLETEVRNRACAAKYRALMNVLHSDSFGGSGIRSSSTGAHRSTSVNSSSLFRDDQHPLISPARRNSVSARDDSPVREWV